METELGLSADTPLLYMPTSNLRRDLLLDPALARLVNARLEDAYSQAKSMIDGQQLAGRLVALDIRQAADAMALQAAMQGRPGQVLDRRLKRIEAVIERQQGVTSEGNNDGLFFHRKDR